MNNGLRVFGFGYDPIFGRGDPKLLAPQPKVWQGYNSRRNAKRRQKGKGGRKHG